MAGLIPSNKSKGQGLQPKERDYRPKNQTNDTINKYVKAKSVDFGSLTKSTYESFIALWDAIPNSKFVKVKEGVSSNDKDMYSYRIENGAKETILWTFVMHGWEWKAGGVALNFFEDMFSSNGYLGSLSQRYNWIVLPCMNPYGFDNDTRNNADGDDINRDAGVLDTPEGNILNDIIASTDNIISFIDWHAQNTVASSMSWNPPSLRTRDYNKMAIRYTANQRRRLKEMVDISSDSDLISTGLISRPTTTAGIWVEWAWENDKVKKFSGILEPYDLLSDVNFQNFVYASFIEACRVLIDDDNHQTALDFSHKILTEPSTATTPKNMAIANRAYFMPVMFEEDTLITDIKWGMDASNTGGDMELGIYDKELNKINSVPKTVSSGASTQTAELNTVIEAGLNYVAITSDTLNTVYLASTGGGATLVRTSKQDPAFPLPAKAVPTGSMVDVVPLINILGQ